MTEQSPPRLRRKAPSVPRTAEASKVGGGRREHDIALGWVDRDYPQLATWRALAVEWMRGESRGVSHRLFALTIFLERYVVRHALPLDPAVFLARSTVLPDFYQTACPDSKHGVECNNYIHLFLHFVLLQEFSTPDVDGHPLVLPDYRNPIAHRSKSDLPRLDESVYSPLPYGYIDELRKMLAAGPHFRDWRWAHSALGVESGRGGLAPEWFPVAEAEIDRGDPDCVWRVRQRTAGGPLLEMWSPVRWVALLIKLLLPLRTFQVRMLDSGEADTWRYQSGNWVLNPRSLAEGSERRPLQQGVFRRTSPLTDGEPMSSILYINTNKTRDIAKSGPDKGYTLPWPTEGRLHELVFYWLEKLRDWQEKYNPIQRRTAWTELDARHLKAKSEMQLASYPAACFLFRLPEAKVGEQHLVISDKQMQSPWFALLEALETRLARRNETHSNGVPILLLPTPTERSGSPTTLFPLHSLRVALVTALALDGQVPFPILQKLVGHSRLMMTLYYTKPGAAYVRDVLTGAAERLEASKEASIQNFLLDTEHDQLLQQAICNSAPSLAAAIPQHPAARNPVGWMPLHHGLCLVGGNTSEVKENSAIGGCYNGGPNIGSSQFPKYLHVPGGSRNCVRCRWFVTEPHYLSALGAHFNTIAYHFDEARNACLANDKVLQDLKRRKADAEEAGQPFARLDAYRQAERVWETAMKRFSDLAEDLVACYRLMERCQEALESTRGDGAQLVAAGTLVDVHLAFEETESELLQLAGVCQNAEIYPDLEPGKAVFRRSQLLDGVLYRDNLPPIFMLLSEQEQLRLGNAFMNRLAQEMNPANPALGQREVIRLMDAGSSLSEHFGIDLSGLLSSVRHDQSWPSVATRLAEGCQ
ncbi:integrase [Paraburkholderia madseniana]|uniref:Integrase n=1 Tax=Paraburkholderia madseniana TaxID=2599607 RepID=A0A6N6WFJ4_9BURK|nr:integrase family protein [Paraburkholderia madseniana]KAE8758678.1 integrase [Paraburkholderia madseniana]